MINPKRGTFHIIQWGLYHTKLLKVLYNREISFSVVNRWNCSNHTYSMLRRFIVPEDVKLVYNDTFKYSSLSANTCIPKKITVWIHPYQLHIVPFKILPIHKFTTFHSKTHIRQEILQVMLKQFSSCSENVCVMHFSSW